jgi:antitoxin ParD1/3/4
MIITLTPEQEKFVLERVQSGQYKSVDEVIDFTFQLLEKYELKKREDELKQKEIEVVRQKVLAGMEDIRQGRVVDGEIVFEQLQERLSKTTAQERFALLLSQLPYISDEEQADIEKHFGSPSDYDRADFVDATDWVLGKKELEDL